MRIVKPAIGMAAVSAGLVSAGLVLASPVPAQAASDTIVISEVQTRGSNGGFDEFIELTNVGTAPVDITGWHIDGCNSSDSIRTRLTVGAPPEGEGEPFEVSLAPGETFLATNDNASTGGYDGTVPGDQNYGVGLTDDGGVRLVDPEDGATVDAVAFSAGATSCLEGEPAEAHPGTSLDDSADRISTTDTDNNLADFDRNPAPTPGS